MIEKVFRKNDERIADAEEAAVMRSQGLIEWVMHIRGISNKDLADRLDVSQSAVSQMLGLSPKNLSVKKLARVLKVLDDELVITSKSREEFLVRKVPEEPPLWIEVMAREAPKRVDAPKYELPNHANDDHAFEFGSAGDTSDKASIWVDKSRLTEVA